jgi:hypothetical protein
MIAQHGLSTAFIFGGVKDEWYSFLCYEYCLYCSLKHLNTSFGNALSNAQMCFPCCHSLFIFLISIYYFCHLSKIPIIPALPTTTHHSPPLLHAMYLPTNSNPLITSSLCAMISPCGSPIEYRFAQISKLFAESEGVRPGIRGLASEAGCQSEDWPVPLFGGGCVFLLEEE